MDENKTKKMEKEYLESNGTLCPICKSDNITCIACADDSDSKNKIKRTLQCQQSNCNASWYDYYVLSEIEMIFDGKERITMAKKVDY